MKKLWPLFLGLLLIATPAWSGTLKQKNTKTPTWEYRDNGYRVKIRKRNTKTPSYHWKDNYGNSGIIKQKKYRKTPTWEIK